MINLDRLSLISVIRIDVNATAETMADIMNWFQSGNNVAVSNVCLPLDAFLFRSSLYVFFHGQCIHMRNEKTPNCVSAINRQM